MNFQPFSQMRRQLISFDGKHYKRDRVSRDGDVWYLVCDYCGKGTAKMNATTGLCTHGNVAHAPGCHLDVEKYAKRKMHSIAKQHYAVNPRVTPTQANIHGREGFQEQHGAGLLPENVTISQSSLKRARARLYPPPPHTLADVPVAADFPENLCYVNDADNVKQPFLMVNQEVNGDPNTRILGFSTPSDLRRLALADKIYLDGTFKVTPKPFYQLFTINTMTRLDENRGSLFPRVYFLLPNKSGQTYQQAMQIVLDLIAEAHNNAGTPGAPIHWERVSCDFESGLLQAIPTINTNPLAPPLILEGCHFHYCSAVFKYATTGQFSMLADYNNPDNLLRVFLQYVYALPMLREEEMRDAFMDIVDQRCPPTLLGTARMNHFIEYIMNTWIMNDTYRTACNCFDRADHRTNNDLEGYHSKLNRIIQPHQNIWRFLGDLRDMHHESLVHEKSVLSNLSLPLRKRSVREKEEYLAHARTLYVQGSYLESIHYLDAIRFKMGQF